MTEQKISIGESMPRPGDPVLHNDVYAGEEKGVSIIAGINGEYLTTTYIACGQENAFRIAEIASSAPLYCKSCGILLKRQGEMHLI